MSYISIREAARSDFAKMISFQKNIYRGNPNYRDYQTRMLKMLFEQKMEIQKKSRTLPVLAEKNGNIVGIAMLASIDRMRDCLQIAFLEMNNEEAVFDAILAYAKKRAQALSCSTVLVGLNLHVNYGLGLLASDFYKAQSLGSAYNPAYYIDIIEPRATRIRLLKSYKDKVSAIRLDNLPSAIQRRLDLFEIRHADFKKIEETARIYSYINNLAFESHKYYYESRDAENLELFNDYKIFLKPENLLFAFYKDEPVGFILWYPDFNQLIAAGEELGVRAFVKSRLYPRSIDALKLTEFGVVPRFQRTAAIYALLKECYELNKSRYEWIESGWILAENTGSDNLVRRFLKQESKSYKVFEFDV